MTFGSRSIKRRFATNQDSESTSLKNPEIAIRIIDLDSDQVSGVGALYVRRRPRVRLEAPQSGGGQERGMRSGTVPTPLVVGFGAACELANQEMDVGIADK